MLTENEKKILKLLFTAVDEENSINNVAKKCGLAPNGAFKILKKFEKEGILNIKKIGNIKSYRINFENEKTSSLMEFILTPDLEGRLKHRFDDFQEIKKITLACIIFGSYADLKKNPQDLDVLFILDKEKFKEYKKILSPLREVIPVKIHDVLQTKEDFKNNLIKKDAVMLDILKTGTIFWGQKVIIDVVKDVYKR